MKHYTIPIFIPELACPFQCIYCNQRAISGKMSIPADKQITETITSYLSTFKKDSFIELGFFGGNFTGIPFETQKKLLSLAQPYIHKNEIDSIRISTRPDYISSKILDLLKSYHVKTIELGVQSLDDTVLTASQRGYDSKTVINAAKLITDAGFDLGMQMMVGLPGDSKEKSKKTAEKIVQLGAVCTRIYPTLVVRNTELAQMYQNGEYKPLSIEQAIDWTKEPLQIFEGNGVTILRVGLHPTEGFITGEDYLDGPFHVSFKELVLTEIWKDRLQKICDDKGGIQKEIYIYIPEKEINYAVGYKSKNKNFLQQYYKKVKFIGDSKLKRPDFEFKITE